MTLILAGLVLALAAFMGMVAAAVLAYVCWNGLMCCLEPGSRQMSILQQIFSVLFGPAPGTDFASRASYPQDPQGLWHGVQGGAGNRLSPIPASIQRPVGSMLPEVRQTRRSFQELHEPASPLEMHSPSPRRRPPRAAEEMSPAAVTLRRPPRSEPVQRRLATEGLAVQLSIRFSGDLPFHVANVQAVTEAYDLTVADLCYCFLCLEGASSGVGLGLKKWGTGSYAARIWLVALARFVKCAQRSRGAQDKSRLEPLCSEWRYKEDHFLQELASCELPFQREHGKKLLRAFQTEEIRTSEVQRAQQVMFQHASAAMTSGGGGDRGQLSLPTTAAALEDGSVRKEAAGKRHRPADEGTVALSRKKGRASFSGA